MTWGALFAGPCFKLYSHSTQIVIGVFRLLRGRA